MKKKMSFTILFLKKGAQKSKSLHLQPNKRRLWLVLFWILCALIFF